MSAHGFQLCCDFLLIFLQHNVFARLQKKKKKRKPELGKQPKRINSSRDLNCKDHVENWVIKYSRGSFVHRSCAHSLQSHSNQFVTRQLTTETPFVRQFVVAKRVLRGMKYGCLARKHFVLLQTATKCQYCFVISGKVIHTIL